MCTRRACGGWAPHCRKKLPTLRAHLRIYRVSDCGGYGWVGGAPAVAGWLANATWLMRETTCVAAGAGGLWSTDEPEAAGSEARRGGALLAAAAATAAQIGAVGPVIR